MNVRKKYHVGLALGPTHVGYAVMDSEYHLLKSKGQPTMGTYSFDEAENATERRMFRTNKRRLKRRQWRINLLEKFFKKELAKVDPLFLTRLHESDLAEGDEKKRFHGDFLFGNTQMVKEYYNKYPTMYHLRYALMTEDKKFDLREIYLAIHHIVKYRGNFLNNLSASEFKNSDFDLASNLSDLSNLYLEISGNKGINLSNADDVQTVLFDNQMNRRNKVAALKKLLALNGQTKSESKSLANLAKEIGNALIGMKANFSIIIDNPELIGEVETKFSLADEDVDDKLEKLQEFLSEEQIEVLQLIKHMFNQIVLYTIVPDGKGISESMMAKYELHKHQLALLKQLYAQMTPEQINAIKLAYSLYIDGQEPKPKKIARKNRISQEDVGKLVKKVLQKLDDSRATELLEAIELGNFLPKQRTRDNAVIPNQLHQLELDAIIENQAKYYPWLAEENPVAKHKSRAPYKLDELLTFKVPYYVGPLITPEDQKASSNANFAWMVRKEGGKITPYNFYDKVDTLASADRFIKRMIATDTYLLDEPVMPNNSLVYQRFKVLNDLNNLKVNNRPLPVGLKQEIYRELFLNGKSKSKNVSKKALVKFITPKLKLVNNINVTGLTNDTKFDNNLGSYHDMAKIFGPEILATKQAELEEFIEWITIFEDKNLLREKLSLVDWLSPRQIDELVALNYKGWGNLSKRLIAGITDSNGQRLIDALWNTQGNLNHLLSLNDFREAIFKHNEALLEDKNVRDVIDDAYMSASVKKTTRKALQVLEDIEKIMGGKPDSISIEYLKDENNDSSLSKAALAKMRLNELDGIFNGTDSTWVTNELVAELNPYLNGEKALNDKDYLYFTQLGYDIYTGHKLDLEKLDSYHCVPIVPLSYMLDNTLNNRVLTSLDLNPTSLEFPAFAYGQSMRSLWNEIADLELFNPRKLALLHTDPKELSKNTILNLTRYQLMDKSFISKFIAEILQSQYKNSKIIKILPKYPKQLRDKLDLPKIVEVNDYQHAFEAYLTTVSGRYLYNRYPDLRPYFIQGDFNFIAQKFSRRKLPEFNFFYDLVERDELTELLAEDNLNVLVNKTDLFNNLRRAYNFKIIPTSREVISGNKAMFKMTLYPVDPNRTLIPKKLDKPIELYGGYTSSYDDHLAIVKVESEFRVIGIPVRCKDELQRLKDVSYKDYINRLNEIVAQKLKNRKGIVPKFRIIIPKLFMRTLVYDPAIGSPFRLASATTLHNASQLVLSEKSMRVLATDKPNDKALVEVYSEILERVNNSFALYDINKFRAKLTKGIDDFKDLDTTEKHQILKDILSGLHANATTKKIKFLGTTPLGFMQRTNGIILSNQAKIIYQSPTGILKKVVKLNQQ